MTFRGPFLPKPFYYSVWEHRILSLSRVSSQLCSSSCSSPLLPLTSVRQTAAQQLHPALEMHFSTSPGLYHSCHWGYIAVPSCHMEILMGLRAGTCVLPLPSLASVGSWWHLQFDVCIAPGTWGTPQQGASNTQHRAQEMTKSSLVPQATGRGQHVSVGTRKVNAAVTCSNRMSNTEHAGTPQQPSLSAAVASKNPGDIRGELEMMQV